MNKERVFLFYTISIACKVSVVELSVSFGNVPVKIASFLKKNITIFNPFAITS